ncbi:MAG: hypothetical protein CMJ84_07405 [Planctomycetes bacterium]|jgi:hypothetical protein|nr:hypothetical protein [Planctomycetota bacterium]MDP6410422.1 VCBS repeat-containing protein [Planctomycetota bacterium]
MGSRNAITILVLLGCAAEEAPFQQDILLADGVARQVGAELQAKLLEPVVAGKLDVAVTALTRDFEGSFPRRGGGREVANDGLDLRVYTEHDAEAVDRSGLVEVLAEHAEGWASGDRLSFDTDRFFLDLAGEHAHGRASVRLGGTRLDGGRADLRVECEVELVRDEEYGWRIALLHAHEGARAEGGVPPFVEVSGALGFTFNESARNRSMIQEAIDEHRTLALGGLTALDWNRDGFWDLIATRQTQESVLFLNDGHGGFVRGDLPIDAPLECSNFLLWFDLDGDGLEELVGTTPLEYEGDHARLGLWTRRAGHWTRVEGALEFPNPVGLRHIAIPTLVPFDADGDGLVDLFAGAYGDANSRGDDFNTVLALDGGDNHLFVNHGDLRFSEESSTRGLSGTQYTFVAQPFDFDADGDLDLFEGNDFGPNVLWENDGDGHFRADRASVLSGESAYTMGATLADPDNTGEWSLYISNMFSEAGNRIASLAAGLSDDMRTRMLIIANGNMLYTRGSDGEWTEQARELHCNNGEWAWGTNYCDLDNDGDKDLIVTNGFTSHSQRELPDW